MSKVIITGPTGNAGSSALLAALASADISHVTVISRRAPRVTHEKLTTIILPSAAHSGSFAQLPASVVEVVKDHKACIWAQGISQTQASKEEYVKITHDYPMEAARAFKSLGTTAEPFRFVYLSGDGADQTQKSSQIFAREKGRTEAELHAAETDTFRTISARAGGIIPSKEHRPHMSWMMRYGLVGAGAVFKVVYPSMVIDSDDLGRALVDLSLGKGWERRNEQGYVNNAALKQLADQFA